MTGLCGSFGGSLFAGGGLGATAEVVVAGKGSIPWLGVAGVCTGAGSTRVVPGSMAAAGTSAFGGSIPSAR